MLSYELIKEYYQEGRWAKYMVANAVVKGVITEEQYKEIIGEAEPSSTESK